MTRKAAPKAREAVQHHRARPCDEVEDGQNFDRFNGLAGKLLSLSPEDAYGVRMASQPPQKPRKSKRAGRS